MEHLPEGPHKEGDKMVYKTADEVVKALGLEKQAAQFATSTM